MEEYVFSPRVLTYEEATAMLGLLKKPVPPLPVPTAVEETEEEFLEAIGVC